MRQHPKGATRKMANNFITKDSGKRIKYKSGFNRDVQDGKPRYDLIPAELLKRLADLYSRGAEKYGDSNWKKAVTPEELKRFKASAWRHFVSWDNDWEKEEDHAVAVIFNIMSYEWITKHK